MRPLVIVDSRLRPEVPYAEKRNDHDALIQGYLTTLITRNYSPSTRQQEMGYLHGWFEGQMVWDPTHPER